MWMAAFVIKLFLNLEFWEEIKDVIKDWLWNEYDFWMNQYLLTENTPMESIPQSGVCTKNKSEDYFYDGYPKSMMESNTMEI